MDLRCRILYPWVYCMPRGGIPRGPPAEGAPMSPEPKINIPFCGIF